MGFFDKVEKIARPIDAIRNFADEISTTDEERLQADAVIKRMELRQDELQTELNKVEIQHRSLFVAGWRPLIGYICAGGLLLMFIVNPILAVFGVASPAIPSESLMELVLGMLGLGALRTYEKLAGRTK